MNVTQATPNPARTAGPLRLTRLVMVAATAGLLVQLAPAATMATTTRAAAKPTIVLVHGAWAGPSSWKKVAGELNADGYRTVTPRLHLMSVADDVATVRAALDDIRGKKVLVAHSYGGFVISSAAAGRSDVLGLVYSAAFVPDRGDSVQSLGTGFLPSGAFNHLAFLGEPFASPCYIEPPFFRRFFAQDLPAKRAALLNAKQQPINFPIVGTHSGPVAWHRLPSWYAVSGHDGIIDPAEERWMAKRAGSTTVEYATASHVGGITRFAGRFTNLIERAVHATAA
jgi:pimeloyl-ACP methyl ester carboxylesterase